MFEYKINLRDEGDNNVSNRNQITKLLGLFTLLVCHAFVANAAVGGKPPNIVLILADDLPWYGTAARMEKGNDASNTSYQNTPNIDRLAQQGITFSHAYATSPICGPSRANIQLGTSAIRSRYTANSGNGKGSDDAGIDHKNSNYLLNEPHSRVNLPDEATTLAEKLGELNYKTAHFGKWHVWGGGPEAHGYDKSHGDTSNKEGKPDLIDDDQDPKRMFSITEDAIRFMTRQVDNNRPFYVQLSHYVAHKKYDALNKTIKKYMPLVQGSLGDQLGLKSDRAQREYATRLAMMEDFDGTIGTLMSALKNLDVAGNTYVIFTSDNGYAWDTATNNLRGDKWWLFEAGLRVPLIVKGPRVPRGSKSSVNVSHYDLYPTFVDWAGGNAGRLQDLDGVSLKTLMENPAAKPEFADRNLYFHYPHNRKSTPHAAVINDQFKLIMFYEHLVASNSPDKGYFLFDLRNGNRKNPFGGQREKNNRFVDRPGVAYQMEQAFHEYLNLVTDLPIDFILPTYNPYADSSLNPVNVDKVVPPVEE